MAFPTSPNANDEIVKDNVRYRFNVTRGWEIISTSSTTPAAIVAPVPEASATPPASPKIGDFWFNTTTDRLHRWTSDGSTSFWFDVSG